MQGENVLAAASRLLAHFDGLAGLGRTTFAELCAQRGLSEAKACQFLAALELVTFPPRTVTPVSRVLS